MLAKIITKKTQSDFFKPCSLRSMVTKKLHYRIMDYLLDRENTVTSTAEDIKSKKANVSVALRELEKKNIVVKEIIGKSHKYGLNYLHPEAKEIIKFLLVNRANELNNKLKDLPKFINAYLKLILGQDYAGLIVFGSVLTGKYRDIDIFVIMNKLKSKDQIIENLLSINKKISPIIGTKKELQEGFSNNDALYANIINGMPFGCLDFIINLRYKHPFLKRNDVEERYLIGYREILNCKKFSNDKIYIKNHLERGIFDIIYALLGYKQITARNDREAEQLFKEIFKQNVPKTLKQADIFALKMKKVIFY